MTAPTPVTPRPTPIRSAAVWASKLHGTIGGLAAALVTFGLLSSTQDTALTSGIDAVNLALSAVVGLIAAGSALAAAFSTVHDAEPAVTPLSDPRDSAGRALVVAPPPPDPALKQWIWQRPSEPGTTSTT